MFSDMLDMVTQKAEKKYQFFQTHRGGYILSSAWAGAAIGIGMILISFLGGVGQAFGYPMTKAVMGASFSVALSIVMMMGIELFTGNNLVMTVGALQKKFSFPALLKIWTINYMGNFVGALVLSILYIMTDIEGSAVASFILELTELKIAPTFTALLVKGILCNVLVCLAVLFCLILKSETAKLIMIFWCIYTFITCGFEHSIANMTLFSLAMMLEHPETITMAAIFHNLIPVTIGNIIGGGLFIGCSVYYLGKK